MKRILFAATILTFTLLPSPKQVHAEVAVSVDFFYDNLGAQGNWVELDDYGYCWQPSVAASSPRWRPYADGYWAYTDLGWTWVSNEDFGWATYHYGRWIRLHDRGWFWIPGREWGPAWVSWRTGGDYVGWAPLPPRSGRFEVVDDNSPITGQVDIEFDIGPAYYNFVDVRYIGEPVLRERILEPSSNVTYITQTVNVTNITYNNSVVYSYGPDYSSLSQYSTRPIRRMTLERDVNANVATKPSDLLKVQGDKLVVAAPQTLQKPPTPVAPKSVKEKIAKPTLERGWESVSDPKTRDELKHKMKSEDPKSVPPPNLTPHATPAAAQIPGAQSPATGRSPAAISPVAPMPRQSVPPTQNTPQTKVQPVGREGSQTEQSPNAIQPKPSVPLGRGSNAVTPEKEQQAPIPPNRATPPKEEPPSDVRPKQAIPPKQEAPTDVRANPQRPQLRFTPPPRLEQQQRANPRTQPQQSEPSDQGASPRQEAAPDFRQKQPFPKERGPAVRQDPRQPVAQEPPRNVPAHEMPPGHEVPSEVHKQPLQPPGDRMPPAPEKHEGPRRQPPEKAKASPAPGS